MKLELLQQYENDFRRALRHWLPAPARGGLRYLRWLPIDIIEKLTGRRDPLSPPRRKTATIGVTDFRASGKRHLEILLEHAGLRPDDAVLDIGCGYGRMGAALHDFFGPEGTYDGLDINATYIEWCRANLTKVDPRLRFHHADIANTSYNPSGSIDAGAYRLPFEDTTFDLVLLESVFTHMLPQAVNNYLREIARVTKPGGRTFVTYYLLNDAAQRCIDSGASAYAFERVGEHHAVADPKVPDLAVAYDETFVESLYEQHNLRIQKPVLTGWWTGAGSGPLTQDAVIAVRN